MRSKRVLPAFVVAVVVVTSSGCSDPYAGRYEVSGAVKLKGMGLPDGATVAFIPQENQGTEATAVVNAGKYLVRRENGLKSGKYLVKISSGDGKTPVNAVNPDEAPGPGGGTNIISKDIVPADWGSKSKQFVTVTADKPNVFDFDIP